MSNIEIQAFSILNEMFPPVPFKRVFEQHYVLYRKQKLFFDFYIPECALLVEVQGEQHIKFVKHFHADKEGFSNYKKRDNLKIEYVQENNLYLVYINFDDEITKDLLYTKINQAMDADNNICK